MLERALQERIKELGCLYAVSRIAAEQPPLDIMLERIAETIPPGFQYPALASARISLKGIETSTPGFTLTPWLLSQPIERRGQQLGRIDVVYRSQPPDPVKPFLDEESHLLHGLAELIDGAAERTESKRALEESEERWRSAMQALTEGIVIKTRDGKVVATNPSAERILGATVGQLASEPGFRVFTPGGAALPREKGPMTRALFRGEVTENAILGVQKSDGADVWLSVSTQPLVRPGEKQPYAAVMSFSDITERRATEAARAESERRLKMMMDLSPMAILVCKSDGQFLEVNHAMTAMSGYSREELVSGRIDWQTLTPADQRHRLQSAVADMESGRQPTPFEQDYVCKDGARLPVLVGVRCLGGPDQLLIGYAIDLTERKKTEDQLRFQSLLLDIADPAIVAHDCKGRITYYNRQAQRLLDWPAEAMLGQDGGALLSPASRQQFETIQAAVFNGRNWSGEVELQQPGRPSFLAELTVIPIRKDSEEIVGTVGVFSDITERKHMEEALARLEKIEAIGVLAGGIAHDFNNVLTAILGNISLARLRLTDASHAEQVLAEAEQAGWRARALTQQLLTFAKGGAPVCKTGSLRPLLEEIPRLTLSGGDVALAIDTPRDLWPAHFDEPQVSQVIQNLIQNAREATHTGDRISVHAQNTELRHNEVQALPAGRYVRFSVSDTGTGIAPDILNKIFDPYFSTKPNNTGLGLAIAHSIIRRHDGAIAVESSLGRGSTVSVYLPAAVADADDMPGNSRGNPPQARAAARVLLMDDEEMVRKVGARMLQHLGYDTVCARDGSEAVALYRAASAEGRPFAAVILDLSVPGGLGGREGLEKLRAIDPAVKALVSSGYDNDPVLAHYAEHGFAGLVPKPYRLEDLREALQKILAPTR